MESGVVHWLGQMAPHQPSTPQLATPQHMDEDGNAHVHACRTSASDVFSAINPHHHAGVRNRWACHVLFLATPSLLRWIPRRNPCPQIQLAIVAAIVLRGLRSSSCRGLRGSSCRGLRRGRSRRLRSSSCRGCSCGRRGRRSFRCSWLALARGTADLLRLTASGPFDDVPTVVLADVAVLIHDLAQRDQRRARRGTTPALCLAAVRGLLRNPQLGWCHIAVEPCRVVLPAIV
mmetsp:Transcript_176816/g.561436  ORF Transcript_176816/g.561436 Transcript_176816/m.561436 type:complete len:232 (+) Transcript_176816:81-776(+)